MLLEVRAFEANQFARLNFSLIEVRRGVQALAAVVSVWQSADALQQMFTFAAATMFSPIPSSSVCSVVPSVQVVTVKLLVQWNLDFTKCQGTGEINSLYLGFVLSKTSI